MCGLWLQQNVNEARTPVCVIQIRSNGRFRHQLSITLFYRVQKWKRYFRLKDLFNGLIHSFQTDRNCSTILLLLLTFPACFHAYRLSFLLLPFFFFKFNLIFSNCCSDSGVDHVMREKNRMCCVCVCFPREVQMLLKSKPVITTPIKKHYRALNTAELGKQRGAWASPDLLYCGHEPICSLEIAILISGEDLCPTLYVRFWEALAGSNECRGV